MFTPAFCICVSFLTYWMACWNSECSLFHLPPSDVAEAEVAVGADEAAAMDVCGRCSAFGALDLAQTASCLATRSLVNFRPQREQGSMSALALLLSSLGS